MQHINTKKRIFMFAYKKENLIILNKAPLRIDPKELRTVLVLETIKEGKTMCKW